VFSTYQCFANLAKVCLTSFAKWEVHGGNAVPPRGRLIVVANHLSYADPGLLAASIPRHIKFVAKQELFSNPITGPFLRSWGAHPATRDNSDMRALRWLISKLEEENVVGIFPEGTRSPKGMRTGAKGLAYLALKTQATILPVGIIGSENIKGALRVVFPFCRVTVNIGQPFSLPLIDGRVRGDVLQSLTDMIMARVASLLPEDYRGVYSLKTGETQTR